MLSANPAFYLPLPKERAAPAQVAGSQRLGITMLPHHGSQGSSLVQWQLPWFAPAVCIEPSLSQSASAALEACGASRQQT